MRDAICKECCPYGCDAHFEQAVRDSKRLEWLAKSGAKVYRRTKRSGYIVMNPCHDLLGKQDHDDWRDAIDEAMRSEQ
jgi:hypothetical protein